MRDVETIDSELRLLLAIRKMACEAEGRTPNTARIDALLDERAATAPQKNLMGTDQRVFNGDLGSRAGG